MKHVKILLAFLTLYLASCEGNPIPDTSSDCALFRKEITDSNGAQLTAQRAYIKNTTDKVLCRDYRSAIENYIKVLAEMWEKDCFSQDEKDGFFGEVKYYNGVLDRTNCD